MTKKQSDVNKEPKYNHIQICVVFRLSHYDKIVVEDKFPGLILTEEEWKIRLKNARILF